MSANYREPQFLLPNCKNLKLPGTGTSVGSGLTEDRHSLYSMDFNGTSLINLDDTNDSFEFTNTPFSVSIWVKGSSTVFRGIICCSSRSLTYGWQIQATSTNKVSFSAAQGTNARTATSTTSLSDDDWIHVVGIFKPYAPANEHVEIWINGTREDVTGWLSTPTLSYQATPYKRISFGYGANTGRRYIGQIDEAAIFSRDLSSNEVNTLYNNDSPSNPMLLSGKPIAYYPLGEQARKPGTANWRFPNEVLQGQAINFDGTDEIKTPQLDLGKIYTISWWFKNNVGNTSNSMVGKTNYYITLCYSTGFYWSFTNSNSSSFRVNVTGTEISNAMSDTGSWHHISLVRKAATNSDVNYSDLEVFLDGNSIYTATNQYSANLPLDNFETIGSDGTQAYGYNGQMSNVAIWNSDQSTNIDNIYNSGAPQTSYTVTPTAWYKLDKTSTFTGLNANWHSALNFDGSSNKITLSSSINTGNNYTVSFWLNPDNVASGNSYIFSDSTTSPFKGLALDQGSSTAGGFGNFYYYTGSVVIVNNTAISGNVWSHIAIVFDVTAQEIKFYINGNLDKTTTGVANIGTLIDEFGIRSTGNAFNGKLSNVAVYNQTISAEDVKYLYNGGTPQTNISFEPTSWYKLDNTGTGIQDSGSASNDGTNNGATVVSSSVAVDEWVFENTVQSQTPNWTSALRTNNGATTETDYVNLSTAFTTGGASDNSISFWLKTTQGSGDNTILGHAGSRYITVHFNRIRSNSTSGDGFRMSSNAVVNDGVWHHVVYTYNQTSGAWKVYVDGDFDNSVTAATGQGVFPINRFGGRPGFANFYYDGFISNVAYYDVELNSSQISTLYNNGQPETTISSSPVSWWKLDNTTDGIEDSVGSNDGTNNGAAEIQTNVWKPRLNGESDTLPSTALVSSDLQFNSAYSSFSLDFDGTDHVDCTNSSVLDITGSISISCWIKSSNTDANRKIIVKDDGGSNRSFQINANHASNGPYTYFWLEGNIKGVSTGVPNQIVDGNWHHVVSVFKSGEYIRMYIDGVQAGNTNVTETTLDSANTSFIISTDGYGGTAGIDGKVDEVSVFNKALNQAEITSIYNNGYPKDITALAPVSWWRLGEDAYFNGNDFIVPNKITGAPNGTSNGMPATALVADAPGSYAAGLATGGLALDDRLGDAPLSTANSLSFNMTPENKISYPAGYVPPQVDNVDSMNFDSGSSNYFNVGTSLFTGASINSISISCWIKTTAGNANAIISKDQATNTNRVFLLQLSGGNLFWQHIKPTSTTTFQNLSTTYNVADGNWHHIVVTYKAGATSGIGEKKIYVDGEEKASDTTATLSDIYNNASIPIEIGRRGDQPSGARYFNGNIDEVAIFDYALTPRQIKQDIYNATTSGKTADLNNNSNLTRPVAWYRMGD